MADYDYQAAMATKRFFGPDAAPGTLQHRRVTLGSPGTVTTLALPDAVKGVRISPTGGTCRFAISEDPAAAVATDSWGAGGFATADEWNVRLLPPTTGRDLRLISETDALVVDVEVF